MLQFFQGAQLQESQKYTVYDFYYRIKKLEKVCNKENIDGLLIIIGVDSRDNQEYVKLINWLFLGYSGIEIESNEILDEGFNDMVIVIKKDHICLYSDRAGFDLTKQFICALPNVQIFTPTSDQDDNKDECELLKITQFLKMMAGVKKVGVLLGKKDNGKLKNIEKWPLIQSYAIEELKLGFFSVSHQPVDLTSRINQLYKPHDKHSLKNLINLISFRLQGHIQGAIGQISDLKMKKRGDVSEEQLVEVFKDTFEIEEMNKFLKRQTSEPYVLLGLNTNQLQTSSSITIKQCTPCLHLIVETFDLLTSLKCSRTYFLTKQIQFDHQITTILNPDEHFIEGYKYDLIEQQYYPDEKLLMNLYAGLIQCFQDIMSLISKDYRNMTEQFIKNYLFDKLKQEVQVQLKSFNAFGEEGLINFKDAISFKLTPQFFTIRFEINNIRSIIDKERLLGGIIFSESFILQENCYLLLTKQTPYLRLINTVYINDEIELIKKRLPMEPLGKQLTQELCEGNQMFLVSPIELPIMKVSYILHQNGLRLTTDELGWFLILFRDIENIVFTSGMKNTWMVCTLKRPILLESLGINRVAFEFIGKSVEGVFFPMKKIFDEQKIPYQYIQDIPGEFNSLQGQKEILGKEIKKVILQNQILDSNFLLDYLESKQMTILNQMKDLKLANFRIIYEHQAQNKQQQEKVGLLLITGSYSTGKNKFAQSLLRYTSENQLEARALTFNLIELAHLDETGWIQKLHSMAEKLSKVNNQTKLIICVVPFFLNIEEILQQLDSSKLVYIRSVVSKVNANTFFNEHNQLQSSISQLLPGYAQSIILDSFGNYESDVDDLHKILRNTSVGVQIYKVTNNIVVQGVAKAILEDISYTSANCQFLRTKMASMRSKFIENKKVFVPWTIPFTKSMRQVFTKAMKNPFKQLQIPPSKKKLNYEEQEIQKLMGKKISIKIMILIVLFDKKQQELDENHQQIIYMKGFVRYDDSLEKGIYEITGNYNYVIERTVKNVVVKIKQVQVDGHEFQVPTYMGWNQEEELGFFVYGQNINLPYCQNILQNASKQRQELQKYLSKEDLSEETIKKIEFDNRGYKLDHGYFFDGSKFRNEDGLVEDHHPRLNELIEEYLMRENAIIEKQNDAIEKKWRAYLKAFQ